MEKLAQNAVTLEGDTVVDLYGGFADLESRSRWTEKTMQLCGPARKRRPHSFAQPSFSRILDLDAPVSNTGRVWCRR